MALLLTRFRRLFLESFCTNPGRCCWACECMDMFSCCCCWGSKLRCEPALIIPGRGTCENTDMSRCGSIMAFLPPRLRCDPARTIPGRCCCCERTRSHHTGSLFEVAVVSFLVDLECDEETTVMAVTYISQPAPSCCFHDHRTDSPSLNIGRNDTSNNILHIILWPLGSTTIGIIVDC
jgi:hypothetical protein